MQSHRLAGAPPRTTSNDEEVQLVRGRKSSLSARSPIFSRFGKSARTDSLQSSSAPSPSPSERSPVSTHFDKLPSQSTLQVAGEEKGKPRKLRKAISKLFHLTPAQSPAVCTPSLHKKRSAELDSRPTSSSLHSFVSLAPSPLSTFSASASPLVSLPQRRSHSYSVSTSRASEEFTSAHKVSRVQTGFPFPHVSKQQSSPSRSLPPFLPRLDTSVNSSPTPDARARIIRRLPSDVLQSLGGAITDSQQPLSTVDVVPLNSPADGTVLVEGRGVSPTALVTVPRPVEVPSRPRLQSSFSDWTTPPSSYTAPIVVLGPEQQERRPSVSSLRSARSLKSYRSAPSLSSIRSASQNGSIEAAILDEYAPRESVESLENATIQSCAKLDLEQWRWRSDDQSRASATSRRAQMVSESTQTDVSVLSDWSRAGSTIGSHSPPSSASSGSNSRQASPTSTISTPLSRYAEGVRMYTAWRNQVALDELESASPSRSPTTSASLPLPKPVSRERGDPVVQTAPRAASE